MKTLTEIIEEKKFGYVNSEIEKNFTATKVPVDTEYKLFHFDKYISSEDAIREIEKNGWKPATLSHLLSWKDWNEKNVIIALGSVAEVSGRRFVPYLDEGGSGRSLDLGWFGFGWRARCRFLAVRNLSLKPSDTQKSDLSTLESLTLRIEKLEEFEKKVRSMLVI